MKVMNLALANIRKSKSETASLLIFILIAALLLNLGVTIVTQINSFFDQKAEQLKDPHLAVIIDEASYKPSFSEYLTNYPGVINTEIEEVVNMEVAKFNFGEGELSTNLIFLNADAERNIAPLKLLEQLEPASGNGIYMPYSFKQNSGYQLGDSFSITYKEKSYQFQIAGFFETTMMGTSNISSMKVMLTDQAYQQLAAELDGFSDALMLSAVMEDPALSGQLENDMLKEIESTLRDYDSTPYYSSISIQVTKDIVLLTVNIIAVMLVTFSCIIVLVSLIVIKFRVSNNIEDGMTNIGVLKAIGYTSKQILSSIALQYILVSVCGSIIGIALSYALIPLVGAIISTLCGLIWTLNLNLVINAICMLLITCCVVIVTLLSAFRVRKLHPIIALRGGIQTHSFRKVYFPLESTKGGLHFLLALKAIVANLKQNIMIFIIIAALTFASVFSAVFYYNIATDKTAFVNLFGAEPASVMIIAKPDIDAEQFKSQLQKMDHVNKVNILDTIATKIDGETVYTDVTLDYNELINNTVYEGRQPKHENEISISWVVADLIDKGIGDTVEVEYGAETGSFLVTGLSQSIGNLGQTAALSLDGVRQLDGDYTGKNYYVYLDGGSPNEFLQEVQQLYGDTIAETLDMDEIIQAQTSIYVAAVFAIMIIVLTITVLVVVTIIYLIIKTMITKRKKEFGIMKAIGYSTIQLMHQISIGFLPVLIGGVALGGVLGYFYTNPMLSLFLSGAGVKQLDFIVHLPIILALCLGILLLGYIVSMLVSFKIRKVTTYSLITE